MSAILELICRAVDGVIALLIDVLLRVAAKSFVAYPSFSHG